MKNVRRYIKAISVGNHVSGGENTFLWNKNEWLSKIAHVLKHLYVRCVVGAFGILLIKIQY